MEFVTIRDLRLKPGGGVGQAAPTARDHPHLQRPAGGGHRGGRGKRCGGDGGRAAPGAAQAAVSRLRRAAAERGADKLSAVEIEAEIAQVRRERRAAPAEE